MKIASEYGGENGLLAKTSTLTDLSISNALSLLKVPEEDRKSFVENHDLGEMTNKELEAEIKQLKEEKMQAKTKEKDLQEEIERGSLEAEKLRAKIISLEGKLMEAESTPAEQDTELVDQLQGEAEALKEALAKAEADLIKTKDKLLKERDKAKEEKASKEEEIRQEVEKKEKEIREIAKAEAEKRILGIQDEKDKLEEDNRQLRKKLEKAGNDSIIKFKILTDQLQDVFAECGKCILNEEDQDKANKMSKAMNIIVDNFKNQL